MKRLGIVGELLAMVWHRRNWALLPPLLALILVGGLIILGQTAPIGPLLYPLF